MFDIASLPLTMLWQAFSHLTQQFCFIAMAYGNGQGQRQVLDEVGVGQALYLLTGLPPFLRVRELRPKNRGELILACRGGIIMNDAMH